MWNIKFIWIDISKQTLDIYNENSNKHSKIKNEEKAIKQYFSTVPNESIIIYEPTWVYWKKLEKTLNTLKKNHYQIHANDAFSLWKTLLWENKTDVLDCRMLVQVAKVMHDFHEERWGKKKFITPNSNQLNEIQVLLTSIRFFKNEIRRFKQQIEYLDINPYDTKKSKKMVERSIKRMKENIEELEKEVLEIYSDLQLTEKYVNLQSVPWIWPVCWMELINFFLFLQNKGFWREDKKQMTAYAWINPIALESWTSLNRSKLSSWWKREVKCILFMSGMQWQKWYKLERYKDTTIGKFTARMIEKFRDWKSKRWKSVACAVWKKLLLTARAIFRDDTQYNFT